MRESEDDRCGDWSAWVIELPDGITASAPEQVRQLEEYLLSCPGVALSEWFHDEWSNPQYVLAQGSSIDGNQLEGWRRDRFDDHRPEIVARLDRAGQPYEG